MEQVQTETAAAVIDTPASAPEAPAQPDFAAFEAARIAEARGLKEPPKVEPPAPAKAADESTPEDAAGPKYGDQIAPHIKAPIPQGRSKAEHVRSELLARIAERDAELAQLREQARAVPARQEPPPAAPVAPAPAQEFDGLDAKDPKPKIEDFGDQDDPYEAYITAKVKWDMRVEGRKADFARQQVEARTSLQRAEQAFVERMTAYEATEPKLAEKTAAFRANLDPGGKLAAWIRESPVAPQVLLHLAQHPEAVGQLAQAQTLEHAARVFGKIEALFDAPKGDASSQAPAAAAVPVPKPVIKTSTSAPPPVPALGARPAEPANRALAAVAQNDFAAFEHERIASALAERGRR